VCICVLCNCKESEILKLFQIFSPFNVFICDTRLHDEMRWNKNVSISHSGLSINKISLDEIESHKRRKHSRIFPFYSRSKAEMRRNLNFIYLPNERLELENIFAKNKIYLFIFFFPWTISIINDGYLLFIHCTRIMISFFAGDLQYMQKYIY
jgi:hypothetical protein